MFAKRFQSAAKALAFSMTATALLLCAGQLMANDATIVDAKIQSSGDGKFQIHVTLEHADTGWDHYANRWDVLDQDGNLLGSRTLHHPHVNEQPFTRSLSLTIPPGVTKVTIVASDSVHGDNEVTFELEVPE